MRNQWDNRATSGGGLQIGPGALSPFIKVMMIVNAIVFLLQYILPRYANFDITGLFGLVPAMFWGHFPAYIFQAFTYMFLHGGFGHIFFNLFALWMFGTEIEYAWGSRSFGRFYIICGLAGALLTLLVYPHQQVVTIGASGAIYGVLVAYWLMFPNRDLYFYFLVPVKVKYAIPGMMILGYILSVTGGSNVAHMAHLGGAACGLIYLKLDWRWMRLGGKLKGLRYRRQMAKLEKRREAAADTMKRVDEILDKINEVGIENLSKSDRKFLEDAASNLRQEKDRASNQG